MSARKPWKTTARVYDRKVKAYTTVRLEVDIDWGAVADLLGSKAFANKSKKSAALGGLIKVRVAG